MEPTPYPRFSDTEMQRRHDAVRELMRKHAVDALLVRGGPGAGSDLVYLTNYLPFSPAWAVFPLESDPVVFHHFFNHNHCARAQSAVQDVRWYGPSAPPTLAQFFRDRDLARSRIGVAGLGNLPYGQVMALKAALPEAEFVDLGGSLSRLRWIRSSDELERLRMSAYLNDLACEALERGIKPGLSELDLSLFIHEAFVPHGGQLGLQFMASTSMSQPDRFVPWQYPTRRVLRQGDAVITEITINYWGYGAQIQRPFAVAAAPTALYRELFDVAQECFERVLSVLRPGATSEEVLAASSVIEERGFSVYDSMLHGEAGKNPELGSASSAHPFEPFTFQENMVVVVQPNPVTRDLTAGLQLGGAVLVTAGGAQPLQRYPLKFPVCG